MIAQDTMLVHSNYKLPFNPHNDASNNQIGGVLSQDVKPIGYFSCKLKSAQLNYTVTAKELLGIVKFLQYFHNITASRSTLTIKSYMSQLRLYQ